jgi:hypothetical protein
VGGEDGVWSYWMTTKHVCVDEHAYEQSVGKDEVNVGGMGERQYEGIGVDEVGS